MGGFAWRAVWSLSGVLSAGHVVDLGLGARHQTCNGSGTFVGFAGQIGSQNILARREGRSGDREEKWCWWREQEGGVEGKSSRRDRRQGTEDRKADDDEEEGRWSEERRDRRRRTGGRERGGGGRTRNGAPSATWITGGKPQLSGKTTKNPPTVLTDSTSTPPRILNPPADHMPRGVSRSWRPPPSRGRANMPRSRPPTLHFDPPRSPFIVFRPQRQVRGRRFALAQLHSLQCEDGVLTP